MPTRTSSRPHLPHLVTVACPSPSSFPLNFPGSSQHMLTAKSSQSKDRYPGLASPRQTDCHWQAGLLLLLLYQPPPDFICASPISWPTHSGTLCSLPCRNGPATAPKPYCRATEHAAALHQQRRLGPARPLLPARPGCAVAGPSARACARGWKAPRRPTRPPPLP